MRVSGQAQQMRRPLTGDTLEGVEQAAAAAAAGAAVEVEAAAEVAEEEAAADMAAPCGQFNKSRVCKLTADWTRTVQNRSRSRRGVCAREFSLQFSRVQL
jgi:hypothetical protein